MTPEEFVNSIYLGDRGCKSVSIEGWDERVIIKVDKISRIRDHSGHWNFYSKEDIDDGLIVITGIKNIKFLPSGPIPNDRINFLKVFKKEDDSIANTTDEIFVFRLSVDSVSFDGSSKEVLIEIDATDIHLEDPKRPGHKIIN